MQNSIKQGAGKPVAIYFFWKFLASKVLDAVFSQLAKMYFGFGDNVLTITHSTIRSSYRGFDENLTTTSDRRIRLGVQQLAIKKILLRRLGRQPSHFPDFGGYIIKQRGESVFSAELISLHLLTGEPRRVARVDDLEAQYLQILIEADQLPISTYYKSPELVSLSLTKEPPRVSRVENDDGQELKTSIERDPWLGLPISTYSTVLHREPEFYVSLDKKALAGSAAEFRFSSKRFRDVQGINLDFDTLANKLETLNVFCEVKDIFEGLQLGTLKTNNSIEELLQKVQKMAQRYETYS